MLEDLGLIDYSLPLLKAAAGALLGLMFGAVLQASRFCMRSGVIEMGTGRASPMLGAYFMAFAAAIAGAQAAQMAGLVDLTETRFHSDSLPLGGLILGGLMFGAGMVLSRGCASRLITLSAQGNLRAGMAIVVFAIAVYATLRGVLAEPRLAFSQATAIDAPTALTEILGLPSWIIAAGLIVFGLAVVAANRTPVGLIIAGAAVGIIVAAAWVATGFILSDPFDPQPPEGIQATLSAADGLFYLMMSTAIDPGFPAGFLGGALVGAFLSALIRRELRLESYTDTSQTVRSLSGAALMGIGGVLAGGCTIGAGLTGSSTLALGPLIALAAIIVGAKAMQWRIRGISAAAQGAPAVIPAE